MEIMRNYIKNEGNRKYLIFAGGEGDCTDTPALRMLENNEIPGMLPFSVISINGKIKASYEITSFISVTEMIENNVTAEEIMNVTETVMNVLENADEFLINPASVILNTDYMYYSPEQNKIYLCVEPFITSENIEYSLTEFMRDFVCRIKFDSRENCDYIGKILGLINSGEEFSIEKFRALNKAVKISAVFSEPDASDETKTASEEIKKDNTVPENINCHKSENESYTGDDIMSFLDEMTDENEEEKAESRKSIFSRLFSDNSSRNKSVSGERKTEKDFHCCDSNGEILIPDDGAETVMLKNRKDSEKAVLLRVKDNRKTEITGKRFKIGSDRKSVDYCISDNSAVSRVHAEILKKGNFYYLVDNNSTNHSYVNNQALKGRKEIRLSDNSRIKLADEEFTFNLSY